MGTTSNAIFTGSSQFAQDFQNVITRAVNIASLPLTLLNNQKSDLTNQSTALSSLDAAFTALQSAVSGITNAFGGSGLQATVSDSSKLSVALGTGAVEGTYGINITDPGTYGASTTASNWDAAPAYVYKLSLSGQTLDLTVADNSAASVAAAVNTQYGSQVHATVVNVAGSAATPDYRISLQSVQLGDLDPQILQDGVSIQDEAHRVVGTPARYTIGNSNNPVISNSRTVSVASGVTLTLLGGTGAVTVTVGRTASALSNGLSSFASAYNAATDALAKQRGPTAGALSGNQIVNQLAQVLQTVGTYSDPAGAISGLKSLGLDLGSDGHMTFDPTAFTALYNQNPASVASFFGSATSGGFLQSASDALNMVEHVDTGLLPTATAAIKNEITDTSNRIDTQQSRLNDLQTQLTQQMAAADALIASMEQQYLYISSMFQAMQVAAQQYK
jgi:flagellar hook-associated protein 2